MAADVALNALRENRRARAFGSWPVTDDVHDLPTLAKSKKTFLTGKWNTLDF
jgi:hypothetical protein